MRMCKFFLTTTNLSYGQKYWHFSDHTNFILTYSSGALYNNKGRYTVSKLGLLATTFWQQTTDTAQPHWATSHFDTQVKCALRIRLAALQHFPWLYTALFMAMALLYNTDWCLSVAYVVFLYSIQFRYRCIQQQHCHFLPSCSFCIILHASTWLQLPALSNPLLHGNTN